MSITVMGLSVTQFPKSANPDLKRAKLDVLYTHTNVNSEKIVRKSVGRTSEVPFGKEPLSINVEYCEKLIDSGAFVSGKDYEVEIGFNSEEMASEIIKLIPTDPQVAKHFDETLKAYKG